MNLPADTVASILVGTSPSPPLEETENEKKKVERIQYASRGGNHTEQSSHDNTAGTAAGATQANIVISLHRRGEL